MLVLHLMNKGFQERYKVTKGELFLWFFLINFIGFI